MPPSTYNYSGRHYNLEGRDPGYIVRGGVRKAEGEVPIISQAYIFLFVYRKWRFGVMMFT